jgi:hypothetical protein
MPSVRKKTLFLEIDGVLHHRSATVAQFLNRMPTLEAAIGASVLDIIICSKWRLENSFEKLTTSFPATLRTRIVGVTGPEIDATYGRLKEIQACCKERGITAWRALDAHAYGYPEGCPELILCSGAVGISRPQAEALSAWLKS